MNFNQLEELIGSDVKEITLTEDVILHEDYGEGIKISKEGLVIDGNGHTIDANHLGRIFIVEANDVTLKNINFINGKTEWGGGAIVNYGVSLRIINCSFKDNLTNGSISMRIRGGGAIGSYSDMSLEDCKFECNSAFGDNGGAIYLERYEKRVPKVVLKNCDFKNNSSDGANNGFGSSGGAIYNENANLYLYHCRFKGNALTGWNNFNNNESISNGGFLSLNNCRFQSDVEGFFIFNWGHLIIDGVNLDYADLIFNKGSLEII